MRMAPHDRRAAILEAAITAASSKGFNSFLLSDVAEQAECSNALVIKHFDSMPRLRRSVMLEAIKRHHLRIIATGLVNGDLTAAKANPGLRKRALLSLSE